MKRFKYFFDWDWYKFGFGISLMKSYGNTYSFFGGNFMLDVQILWLNFYVIYSKRKYKQTPPH